MGNKNSKRVFRGKDFIPDTGVVPASEVHMVPEILEVDRVMHSAVAMLAKELVLHGGMGASTHGTDDTGMPMITRTPPKEVAVRACAIADKMYAQFTKRGWLKLGPGVDDLVNMANREAEKQAQADEPPCTHTDTPTEIDAEDVERIIEEAAALCGGIELHGMEGVPVSGRVTIKATDRCDDAAAAVMTDILRRRLDSLSDGPDKDEAPPEPDEEPGPEFYPDTVLDRLEELAEKSQAMAEAIKVAMEFRNGRS